MLDTLTSLDRFGIAQSQPYPTALKELDAGRKKSHWMWFIFPQLRVLGSSDRAIYYGIQDLDEATRYLRNENLGFRLLVCARAVLQHAHRPVVDIMGEVDAQKLQSCATLFSRVPDADPAFAEILDTFFAGEPCELTLAHLRVMAGDLGPSPITEMAADMADGLHAVGAMSDADRDQVRALNTSDVGLRVQSVKLVRAWDRDTGAALLLNGEIVATVDYDEDGSAGEEVLLKVMRNIAKMANVFPQEGEIDDDAFNAMIDNR